MPTLHPAGYLRGLKWPFSNNAFLHHGRQQQGESLFDYGTFFGALELG
jgi:hypothetical protein